MSALKDLKFYATQPHNCSYLEDKQAITLFMDPDKDLDPALYRHLADIGFRRSGRHVYRPHCQGCNACIPARVVAKSFEPRRKHRKLLKKNRDILVTRSEAEYDEETYQLYKKYISIQHRDGDMYPPSMEQFQSFLVGCPEFCCYYKFWLDEKLVAVAVTDELSNGLSAIYTFYDPEVSKTRSLGSYCILWQIEEAKKLGLKHLHLGYWIKDCKKMSYKIQYRPLEVYVNNRWVTLR
ncbi:arginyltransferase [Endozoicomonas sp. ALD040]|uniref:arginyltransferase n=1 Tax=unclassified Endozoicomonas TaxID=2644528 RepID=UPI003BAE98A9